jgi:hypothetical protein
MSAHETACAIVDRFDADYAPLTVDQKIELAGMIEKALKGDPGEAMNGDEEAGQDNLENSYQRVRACSNWASVVDPDRDANVLAYEIDRLRSLLAQDAAGHPIYRNTADLP